jgi:predicted GNAT family N-acyltransferase
MAQEAEIRHITTQETYPLRLKILRPGRPLVTAQFAEDERATHFGCFVNDVLVGIASIFPQALAGENKIAWQLRGMAVEESCRGNGFGEKLVQACCDFAASQNAQIIWCNARAEAVAFYQRQGLAIRGDVFLIPDVGPHYVMWRAL